MCVKLIENNEKRLLNKTGKLRRLQIKLLGDYELPTKPEMSRVINKTQ